MARVQAIGQAAIIRQARRKPVEAMRAAQAAIDAAQEIDDEVALARALSVLDYALVMLGDLEAAVNSERSLEIYRRHAMLEEEALIAQNLGVYEFWRGNWEAALERYREGRESVNRIGNAVAAAHAAANIGEVLVNQGRFDEAEEPLVAARRTSSRPALTRESHLSTYSLAGHTASTVTSNDPISSFDRPLMLRRSWASTVTVSRRPSTSLTPRAGQDLLSKASGFSTMR